MAAEINMQELKEETLKKIREMALDPQSGSFLINIHASFLHFLIFLVGKLPRV
jgi:hypothetical protein